jgi:hypothetical protein
MARDTMFGVMMVVLNALVGAANVLNAPIHLLLFVGYFILMFEGRPSFGSAASGPLNQSRTERIPEAAAATISSIMLFTGTPSIR